ncbi:MAG: hypothetical protein HS113_03380 [Verrucomicrobiales bacterium]|nr:hypothetical protein [Verrucomicrobiales bacterium]
MKTSMHLVHGYGKGRGGRWLTLLTGLTLLGGLGYPVAADVIDDFESGKRFGVYSGKAGVSYELVDGHLKVSRPGDEEVVGVYYYRTYELPEGETVTFTTDVLSLPGGNAYAAVLVVFSGIAEKARYEESGYGALLGRTVQLMKWGLGQGSYFRDDPVAAIREPVALTLALTRQGQSLKLGARVVLRDQPDQVLYDREVTDGPGQDPVAAGADSGAPLRGPVAAVALWLRSDPSANPRAEVVYDNFVCSHDQTAPRLSLLRRGNQPGAAIEWEGFCALLEAESVQGPWRPCLEAPTGADSHYAVNVPVQRGGRFYRLTRGFFHHDAFVPGEWSWKTGSTEVGNRYKPGIGYVSSENCGRIRGVGVINADFVAQNEILTHMWSGDCAASVDLSAWTPPMEDASFGIILRARPENVVWHCPTEGLPRERYAGLLTFSKAGSPGESVLSITGPGGEVLERRRFPAVDPQKRYRLQFRAVGDRLTLELFDREQLETPLVSCAANDGRIAEGMVALHGTRAAGDPTEAVYDLRIGRFLFNGTLTYCLGKP